MINKRIYQTNKIYLGTIEVFDEEEKMIIVAPFYRKVEKDTKTISYLPLDDDLGYYFILDMKPIKDELLKQEKFPFLTKKQIDVVKKRENEKTLYRKEKNTPLVERKEVVESVEIETKITKTRPKTKVMKYHQN